MVRGSQDPVGRSRHIDVGPCGCMGRELPAHPSSPAGDQRLVGTGGIRVAGFGVRRALGIRENLFFVDTQRGSDGAIEAWVFTGRGWGHGVGMCQVGAYGMAAAGYGYRQILSHYYAGTRVEHPSPPEPGLDVDKGPGAP